MSRKPRPRSDGPSLPSVTRLTAAVPLLAALVAPLPAAAQLAPAGPRVTISGTRLTLGDGAACPTLRDESGAVHVVSYLSPDIPIGGKVIVTGHVGASLTCFADVLIVESEVKMDK